ncbi:unnamed protein product [Danaus chrysippus]|uniref:(African queen) hypothetical protein n=1 Tax=Danaus chrysippus TaxID=151541 RepID=A0A8J2VXP8_9NEOP|nr:unnamed protein product [Danaus chrysippus]
MRSTKSLANFRKSVEETSIDNHPEKSNHDSDIKFVAFLLENAKKIFSNTDEPNKTVESFSIDGIKLDSLNMPTVNGTTEQNAAYNESHNENNILNLGYLDTNLSKSPSTENVVEIEKSEKLSVFTDYNISLTEIGQLFTEKPTYRNPENFLLLEKKDVAKIDKNARKPQQLPSLEATIFSQKNTRRSCIACNNIGSMDCMDPQNKLESFNASDEKTVELLKPQAALVTADLECIKQ